MTATMGAAGTPFQVLEWRPFSKNTLEGFLTVRLPSGMIVKEVTVHRQNGKRWVGMPARSYQKDGATKWQPLIEFASRDACDRFRDAALVALESYLALQSGVA